MNNFLIWLTGFLSGLALLGFAWFVVYMSSTERLWQRWTQWLFQTHREKYEEIINPAYSLFQSKTHGWPAMPKDFDSI